MKIDRLMLMDREPKTETLLFWDGVAVPDKIKEHEKNLFVFKNNFENVV